MGDAAGAPERVGGESAAILHDRRGERSFDGARDQGIHGWRARFARRVAAGALLRSAGERVESTGINVEEPQYIQKTAELAIDNGFQLCTHAIGDRANREVLNLYEAVFREHPDKKNLRWRIEHAQHLDPANIPRFGELGVIAAMQGIHCTSDGPFVIARLGRQRAEAGAYVWQRLMKSGAVVGNGTDTPVEDVDPIQCYYASVSRRLKDGTVPDELLIPSCVQVWCFGRG